MPRFAWSAYVLIAFGPPLLLWAAYTIGRWVLAGFTADKAAPPGPPIAAPPELPPPPEARHAVTPRPVHGRGNGPATL